MKILFPKHPLKSRQPDPDYQIEFDAAGRAGFDCELYDLEDLRAGDAALATKHCGAASVPGEAMLYRGWMMSDVLYQTLHEALVAKGYQPMVSPEQYAQAHYLPYAYRLMQGSTPESVWVEGRDIKTAWAKYVEFGQPAAIVKDYVKSAKHRWDEACHIPAGTAQQRFDEILTAFLAARGKLFEKGIVLRRYHDFIKLADDLRGQPVHEEYRLFMWDGRMLTATPVVWGNGPLEKLADWETIAGKFSNRFISMDVARLEDGGWMIVEVGDGGVSGLPSSIEPAVFYRELRGRVGGAR